MAVLMTSSLLVISTDANHGRFMDGRPSSAGAGAGAAHPTRLSVLKESSSCWSSLWKITAPIAGRFPAYLHPSHKPASELEQLASLRSTPETLGARVGRVALERSREDEDARVVAALNQVLREYVKRLRKRANASSLTTAARKQGSAHKSGADLPREPRQLRAPRFAKRCDRLLGRLRGLQDSHDRVVFPPVVLPEPLGHL